MKKILLAISILSLVACHKLKKGLVIDKNHYDAYSYIQTTFIMSGKVMIPITQTVYVPERWEETIRGNYKGKPRIEHINLSLQDWNAINIGDSVLLKK